MDPKSSDNGDNNPIEQPQRGNRILKWGLVILALLVLVDQAVDKWVLDRLNDLRDSVITFVVEYVAVLTFLILLAVFLVFGHYYWASHPGLSAADCAFGDAACSAASATWALAAFALLSFFAATRAVIWTKKAFEIEVQLKLGQSGCSDRTESHVNKEIFVTSESQVLLGRRPAGFTRNDAEQYYEHHAAFTNLGRTALADVCVEVCFEDVNKVRSPRWGFHLGSIRCNDEIHVAVYIAKFFEDMQVLWGHATEQGRPLDFYAEDAISIQRSYPLPSTQIALPGMAQAVGDSAGNSAEAPPKPPA